MHALHCIWPEWIISFGSLSSLRIPWACKASAHTRTSSFFSREVSFRVRLE